jgi:hypothetical protein
MFFYALLGLQENQNTLQGHEGWEENAELTVEWGQSSRE